MNTYPSAPISLGIAGGMVPVYNDEACTQPVAVFDLNSDPLRGAPVGLDGVLGQFMAAAAAPLFVLAADGDTVPLYAAAQTTTGGGGVSSLIAGDGVSLDPEDGVGDVTVTATGGGGSEGVGLSAANPLWIAPADWFILQEPEAGVFAFPNDYTYDNGDDGVGATMTSNEPGALVAYQGDGQSTSTTTVGDRVVVADVVGTTVSGVYTVTAAGDDENPWVLTRAADHDTGDTYGQYWAVAVPDGQNYSVFAVSWVQSLGQPPGANNEDLSVALGGLGATAVGYSSALARGAHAEGRATIALGLSAHAEGSFTFAIGPSAHAEGENSAANADGAHAEGQNTTAQGAGSHAEGSGTAAVGVSSHAEGEQTVAVGEAAHAEGFFTCAAADGSHAEGIQSVAYQAGSHAESAGSISAPGDSQYQRVTSNTTTLNSDPANITVWQFLDEDGNPVYNRTVRFRGVGAIARRIDDSSGTAALYADGSGATIGVSGTANVDQAQQTVDCNQNGQTANASLDLQALTLPAVIIMGTNDEFVWAGSPNGYATPEMFTVAPGTLSTPAEVAAAMNAAVGALSAEPFSTYATCTDDGSGGVLVTDVNDDAIGNGNSVASEGGQDFLAAIGADDQSMTGGGPMVVITGVNDQFVWTGSGGGGGPVIYTMAGGTYLTTADVADAMNNAVNDSDTPFSDVCTVGDAGEGVLLFTAVADIGTDGNGDNLQPSMGRDCLAAVVADAGEGFALEGGVTPSYHWIADEMLTLGNRTADDGAAGWCATVTFAIDGNQIVATVSGADDATVYWTVVVDVEEVAG